MVQYLSNVQANLDKLSKWVVKRILRTKNIQADVLVGIASTLPIKEAVLLHVYLQVASSIVDGPVCSTSETNINWMHEIEAYIWTGKLPEDSKQAHKIWVQVAYFTLIGLYRRSFGGSYLRCLKDAKAQYVLAELHEDMCGNHIDECTLAHCAHLQEYYWPTMRQDVKKYVKKCDRCQMYTPIPRMPFEVLNLATSP